MARPALKREELERAVVDVVASKGVRASTTQDIASAAGVSAGLLYRYWKNREALVADVYRAHYTRLVERLADRAAREVEVRDKLFAIVRDFLDFADEMPVVLQFLLLSQHDMLHRMPEHVGIQSLLVRLLREGLAQDKIRDIPASLGVHLILGLVLQPVVGAIYGDLDKPVRDHAPAILGALDRVLFTPASGERG